jgi:superfamily I DNA/RNA helicase
MFDLFEPKIKRLTNMLGTDEGFYILALHSFVEYYLREVKKFGGQFIDGLSSLAQIGKQHRLTNEVRHSFTDIAQLSPEQKSVVDSMKFDHDFLLRGGAGTGKSLVLISGIQRLLSQYHLNFFEGTPVIFITYTKTLIKYSRFTAGLMNMEIPPVLFSTVDTLVFERLKLVDDEFSYDFNIIEEFLNQIDIPDFMGTEELAGEIDEYLIGRLITRDEYCEKLIQREGLKGSLDRQQRRLVWGIRDSCMDFMNSTRRYSVNYGRMRLAQLMDENPEGVRRGLQTVFIDEVQDLNPAAPLFHQGNYIAYGGCGNA